MTTSLKTCFKCDETKPLDAFYRHKMMGDGHLNKCKECTKRDVAEHRVKNIDRIREYDRRRAREPERARHMQRQSQKFRKENPKKYQAHSAVSNAVRDGRLERPNRCEFCDEATILHGHHDDYEKTLEVRWLCPACHHGWHAKYGEAANG